MKRSKFRSIVIVWLLVSAFCGCKKHHHEEVVPESVNINIMAPRDHAQYEAGDTVFFKVKITSPSTMHGYELHVLRLADTTEVYTFDEDIHSSNIDIDKFWVNDGAMHSDATLEVIAVIDHSGKKLSKKVQFHCHEK